jgi:hypothetical protein
MTRSTILLALTLLACDNEASVSADSVPRPDGGTTDSAALDAPVTDRPAVGDSAMLDLGLDAGIADAPANPDAAPGGTNSVDSFSPSSSFHPSGRFIPFSE